MKRGQRNYKAEYQRRIARAQVKGLSRTQARGHAKGAEATVAAQRQRRFDEHRFQVALKALREGKGVSEAAKSVGVSRERLTQQLERTKAAKKKNGRWVVRDDLARRMPLYSEGRAIEIIVPNRRIASIVSLYLTAVGEFLRTNNPRDLSFFKNKSVADRDGKRHPFEADPQKIYELSASQTESFEQVYRIIV
jgi:hypothetical protein